MEHDFYSGFRLSLAQVAAVILYGSQMRHEARIGTSGIH